MEIDGIGKYNTKRGIWVFSYTFANADASLSPLIIYVLKNREQERGQYSWTDRQTETQR